MAAVYHLRPHDGLVGPAVPGLRYSPLEMFDQGIARAERLRVPARADLVYDFLPVVWRTIQHYGAEAHGVRYNGTVLRNYRSRTSPYTGANAGNWPFRSDPDDVSRYGLARMWFTVLLLDIGSSEFKSEIETLALPKRVEKPIVDS